MEISILKHFLNEKVKPAYHIKVDDHILLTAKIDVGKQVKDCGLYFLEPVSRKSPMWRYKFLGIDDSANRIYPKLSFLQLFANGKGHNTIENKLFYTSYKRTPDCIDKNLKFLVVLYE